MANNLKQFNGILFESYIIKVSIKYLCFQTYRVTVTRKVWVNVVGDYKKTKVYDNVSRASVDRFIRKANPIDMKIGKEKNNRSLHLNYW